MLINILIGLAVVVVVFTIIVAMQPADFQIVRSTTISAPPATVFEQVNDFHKWEAWSPWAKIDPNVKNTYEGPSSGPGAVFSWSGNNKVGAGRMTLTDSRPNDFIKIKLEFLRPFKATNKVEFTFKLEGNQTTVTWTMAGKKVFASKAFGLFMDMDKLIGKDFEKGLAQMKAASEVTAKI